MIVIRTTLNKKYIRETIEMLNERSLDDNEPGFVEKIYSPKDDKNIKIDERPFFTHDNAKSIDNIRRDIDLLVPEEHKPFFIAPLLVAVSKISNTPSIYRAFFKDKETGIGIWGAAGKNYTNLSKRIILEEPILSDFNCETVVYNQDINQLVPILPEVDLAYYDPPFDNYPCGQGYFMYNLISKYEEPNDLTVGAGVPKNWNRSKYNTNTEAREAFIDLLGNTKAKYILMSYSTKGIIPLKELSELCKQFGSVEVIKHNRSYYDYIISIKVK